VALRTATRTRTPAGARHTRRAAARTALRSRSHPAACAWPSAGRACPRAIAARPRAAVTFGAVTGFYIAGIVLAVWALVVTAVGVMREDFPATPGATRLVGAISLLLVVAAIGSAIYLSATEDHEPEGEHAAAH
jgi:hypothetical protein